MSVTKRVAALHLAPHWHSSYSPASVLREQIASLAASGDNDVTVLGIEGTERPPWLPASVRYLAEVPRASHVEQAMDQLCGTLTGFDLILTHDLFVLPGHAPYRTAIEAVALQQPLTRWCHFVHARPAPVSDLPRAPQGAHFVCLSSCLEQPTSDAFGVPKEYMHVRPNTLSVERTLGVPRRVLDLIDVRPLILADVALLHPFSLTRLANKQPHRVLFVAACAKRRGRRVQLLFVDFGGRNQSASALQAKLALKWLGARLGLAPSDLQFASDGELETPLSQEEVGALFRLTNVFVHPSTGEASPLSVLEAVANGAVCVVNSNVPSFRDILDDDCLSYSFPPILQQDGPASWTALLDHFEHHEAFYDEVALAILEELDGSLANRAKRRHFRETCSETQVGAFSRFCEELIAHD